VTAAWGGIGVVAEAGRRPLLLPRHATGAAVSSLRLPVLIDPFAISRRRTLHSPALRKAFSIILSRKGGLAYPDQNLALYQRSFARRTGTRTAAEDRLAGLRRAIRREPASPNGRRPCSKRSRHERPICALPLVLVPRRV
jgi:hypothetical protein